MNSSSCTHYYHYYNAGWLKLRCKCSSIKRMELFDSPWENHALQQKGFHASVWGHVNISLLPTYSSVVHTVKSMVRFSWMLVGRTPQDPVPSVFGSGERPFSSWGCRGGRLGSRWKNAAFLFKMPSPAPVWTPLGVGWRDNARLIPAAKPPIPPLARLNFSMHSSIRAGGALRWATTTRPQNNTSNFLANVTVLGEAKSLNCLSFWQLELRELVAPVAAAAAADSSWRSELLLAWHKVVMISGTCTGGKSRVHELLSEGNSETAHTMHKWRGLGVEWVEWGGDGSGSISGLCTV